MSEIHNRIVKEIGDKFSSVHDLRIPDYLEEKFPMLVLGDPDKQNGHFRLYKGENLVKIGKEIARKIKILTKF